MTQSPRCAADAIRCRCDPTLHQLSANRFFFAKEAES